MASSRIWGELIFSVRGDDLGFSEITENLSITPSKLIRKGSVLSKATNLVARADVWKYSIKLAEGMEVTQALVKMLQELEQRLGYIEHLSDKGYEIEICASLRSEYGQMGFHIGAEAIDLLSRLRRGIDFRILSFGLVEDS